MKSSIEYIASTDLDFRLILGIVINVISQKDQAIIHRTSASTIKFLWNVS